MNERASEVNGYEVLSQAFVAEGVDTMFALLGDANMYWGAIMAQKYGVRGVPVFQFFPESVAGLAQKAPREREVVRGQGYIEPQPFLDMFRFVAERAYEKGEVLRLPQSGKFSQP